MKKNTVKTVSLLKQQKILQRFILGTKYIFFIARAQSKHVNITQLMIMTSKQLLFFRGAQNVTPAFYFQEKNTL